MGRMIQNETVKITDVGNFNVLVKNWYEKDATPSDINLDVGDIVNIKVFEDLTVPGGIYSYITKTTGHYTNTLGSVIHDRTSDDYDMKNDRHRIQYTSRLK